MKLRKTPQAQRTKYVYIYDDSKVIVEPGKVTTVNANGEVSVAIDNSITSITIKELHSLDDQEVENNLKSINAEDTAMKSERRRKKKEFAKSHPNEVNPYEKPLRNVRLDAQAGEYGDELGDKSRIEYEATMYANSLEDDPYAEEREQVRAAVATFPKKMQELYELFYVEERKQHEIADLLHINKATVSLRLKKLEERLKKYFREK